MHPPQPFGVLEHYPHMKPQDEHLWEKFLLTNPDFGDEVEYDVLVGEGMIFGDLKTDKYAADFQQLTQKKIDAVVRKGSTFYIFEIKPNAGPTALGQVLSYTRLWRQKHPEATNVHMVILTNQEQSDYAEIFASHSIELISVGFCDVCRLPANYG